MALSREEKEKIILKSELGETFREKILGKKFNDLEINFLHQTLTQSEYRATRPKLVCEELTEIVAKMEGEPMFCQLFYIKIDNVISEIPRFYMNYVDQAKEWKIFDEWKEWKIGRQVLEIVEKSNKLKDKLSREEIIYIEIQRNISCHLNPTGFEITVQQRKDGPKLLDKYKIKVLNEQVTAEEIDDVIENIEEAIGSSEVVAHYIAEKIKHEFFAIYDAITVFVK